MATPTIFIAGITGNTIVNSNTVDFHLMFSALGRYYKNIEPLSLQADERYDSDETVIAERSHIESLAYSELPSFLNSDNGLQLYIFNYDWRKSNAGNGTKLLEYVDYLKSKLKVSRFNFVTHSMGSFIFRAFLKQLPSSQYETVNRAVLTVPPNRGSIEPLKMLVLGKSYLINSADTFRKLARTFPSLYELLPVYDGAFDAQGIPGFDVFDPNQWQSNLYKDEDDSASKEMLALRLKNAKQFIDSGMIDFNTPGNNNLINSELTQRIAIIVGNKQATLEKVKVHLQNNEGWEVSNYFDFSFFTPAPENGDGTVPSESAHYFKDVITTVNVDDSIWHGNPIDMLAGQHALFLTDGRVQSLITRFLNGKEDQWKVIGGSVKVV